MNVTKPHAIPDYNFGSMGPIGGEEMGVVKFEKLSFHPGTIERRFVYVPAAANFAGMYLTISYY